MGMSIDKTISELEILKKNTFSYMSANQAFTIAIETMHKYKKIEQIVKQYKKFGNIDFSMQIICGVVEDGKEM